MPQGATGRCPELSYPYRSRPTKPELGFQLSQGRRPLQVAWTTQPGRICLVSGIGVWEAHGGWGWAQGGWGWESKKALKASFMWGG